jgi:hypothetical protein
MGWDEQIAVDEEYYALRQAEIASYLDNVSMQMSILIDTMNKCKHHISLAYNGGSPGAPEPDSQNARAHDYIDALDEASLIIGNRLNTWDGGNYSE